MLELLDFNFDGVEVEQNICVYVWFHF